MPELDQRAQGLRDWAAGWIEAQCPDLGRVKDLLPVSGDASFRRYFRLVLDDCTLIGVDAPPQKENCAPFVAIAGALRAHGLAAPEVVAWGREEGYMLLSDLGDALLLPALNDDSVDGLYRMAMRELLRMQPCTDVPDWPLPAYDRQRLMDEMGLFRDWFISRHLGLSLTADQHAVLSNAFDMIVSAVQEEPQVFVHRDYHSRNLMLLPDGSLGIIDFQDAVIGPLSYDLISLLRDAYVVWPPERVRGWMCEFAGMAREQAVLSGVSDDEFVRMCDWMSAQRHLKVVGIFARLSIRDGKHAYLDDIPRVFNYLLEEVAPYSEFKALDRLLRETVLPVYLEKTPQARSFLRAL